MVTKRYIITQPFCVSCEKLAAEYEGDKGVETIEIGSIPYLPFVLQRLLGKEFSVPVSIAITQGNGKEARAVLGVGGGSHG